MSKSHPSDRRLSENQHLLLGCRIYYHKIGIYLSKKNAKICLIPLTILNNNKIWNFKWTKLVSLMWTEVKYVE